ncbi:hypothetical protein SAMN04488550_0150 [Gordonia malaquae]|uniref:Uncharacterized protein n=2 Tax=Gordonia TaxID=2053 RepID=M3UZS6_GORML|nr:MULTISPECIES: hypothetical protein [Gordonia]GAC81542.1 hypothetical protein GM1_037_00130 [Gordonia malaquae NBRC 108250]GEE00622.1 hypothetical protein nbrc107696_10680 [Gordonia spumicola]SEB49222.1 hypothetical protein SAMN04488550_0150 [Gordonia malaquae]
MRRLTLLVCTLLLGLTFLAAGPARAEAEFTTKLSGVLTGFESRRWTDGNSDAAATTVRFDNCREKTAGMALASADVMLRKDRPFQPDEDHGTKRLNCSASAFGNWGRKASGKYFFRIEKINGYSGGFRQLNASFVRVRY